MWGWLKSLFDAWDSSNMVALKAMDSEKIQEEKFEIKRERLEDDEWRIRYKKIADYLQMHPKEDIDSYVNVVCENMEKEQKEDVRTALHNRFRNREEKKMRIKK